MKQGIGIVLGILIILFGMMWIVQGNDFFLYKVFAPKYEDVRRETFEHSRAFRQGTIQELEKMALDYNKASDPEKDAMGLSPIRKFIKIKKQPNGC
ncbi:MAG: hypothetical protein V1655_04270 [bacterium]